MSGTYKGVFAITLKYGRWCMVLVDSTQLSINGANSINVPFLFFPLMTTQHRTLSITEKEHELCPFWKKRRRLKKDSLQLEKFCYDHLLNKVFMIKICPGNRHFFNNENKRKYTDLKHSLDTKTCLLSSHVS